MEGADFGDELDDELDVAPAEATVAAATAVTAEAAAAAAAAMEATAAADAADDDDAAEATSPSLCNCFQFMLSLAALCREIN